MKISEIFKKRDSTQGSIIKNILAMTWPLWFNSLAYIVFYGVNIYWVSKLGAQSLAAVVTGGTAFMLMMMPIQGIVTAIYGMVGSLVGQKDQAGLEKLVKEILSITLILSLTIAALGYFFAPILLKLIGAESEVLSLATDYLRIQALGGIITFYVWVINGMLRSAGDMMRPWVIIFVMIVLNGIFDWFFILGNLGFPKWGVAGCALASVLSAGIGAGIGFWILAKGNSPIKINFRKWRDFKIRLKTVKEILGIAGFDALEMSGKVVFDLILLRFIAFWGIAALAAYSIGHRLLRMSSMVGMDLATTTSITMSQNLGAGNIKRAEKSSWICVGFNALIMGIAALIFFVFTAQLMGFYSQDLAVINIGINYLKITALGYIFFAAAIILRRAFGGAKNTRTPMLTSFLTLGLIQLLLAWGLPKFFNLGISGIWLAILVGMVTNGLILVILFKKGFWKKKNLDMEKIRLC